MTAKMMRKLIYSLTPNTTAPMTLENYWIQKSVSVY